VGARADDRFSDPWQDGVDPWQTDFAAAMSIGTTAELVSLCGLSRESRS
jgi:hypothetical protein